MVRSERASLGIYFLFSNDDSDDLRNQARKEGIHVQTPCGY